MNQFDKAKKAYSNIAEYIDPDNDSMWRAVVPWWREYQQAFIARKASGWKPLNERYAKRKGNNRILTLSGQTLDSLRLIRGFKFAYGNKAATVATAKYNNPAHPWGGRSNRSLWRVLNSARQLVDGNPQTKGVVDEINKVRKKELKKVVTPGWRPTKTKSFNK